MLFCLGRISVCGERAAGRLQRRLQYLHAKQPGVRPLLPKARCDISNIVTTLSSFFFTSQSDTEVCALHIRGAISLPARRLRVHARRLQVRKRHFLSTCYIKRCFYQDRLGTNIEEALNKVPFSCSLDDYGACAQTILFERLEPSRPN